MKIVETYEIWQTISFTHLYYTGREIPIQLLPDKTTQAILDKYQFIFRKKGLNTWIILSPVAGAVTRDIHSLCFHIQPTRPVFYYVSEKLVAGTHLYIEAATLPGSWLTFTLRLSARQKDHSFIIPAKSYYWEFLLFLPATQDWKTLLIYEKTNRIQFSRAEKITWPDYPQVISIRTAKPVISGNENNYVIRLKEQKQKRERVLCEYIPPPSPGRLSPTGKQNTITTYFYL